MGFCAVQSGRHENMKVAKNAIDTNVFICQPPWSMSWYATDWQSTRPRFVREVFLEATDADLGEVVTFADLLAQHPGTDLRLWKFWYFGRIPWQRLTVTPESLYRSPTLRLVFDGELADQIAH
jgi:hypothetical protein